MADRTDIYTIIAHLIKNAAESIEKNAALNAREIRIETVLNDSAISVLSKDSGMVQKQAAIAVLVKDTGTGIPTEQWESIFEQYLSGGTTAQRHRMSLSILRKIIRYYYGDISVVSSSPDLGTEFQVIIPCRQVQA